MEKVNFNLNQQLALPQQTSLANPSNMIASSDPAVLHCDVAFADAVASKMTIRPQKRKKKLTPGLQQQQPSNTTLLGCRSYRHHSSLTYPYKSQRVQNDTIKHRYVPLSWQTIIVWTSDPMLGRTLTSGLLLLEGEGPHSWRLACNCYLCRWDPQNEAPISGRNVLMKNSRMKNVIAIQFTYFFMVYWIQRELCVLFVHELGCELTAVIAISEA